MIGPRYFIICKLTGYPAYGGRRFWTLKGAIKKVYQLDLLPIEFYELRKIV